MASTKIRGATTTQYKIRCKPTSVVVGDEEYLSATEALEAYLSQYEKQGIFSAHPTYKRTVTDLFDPKSSLHMTAERSIKTGVRATSTELRLSNRKEKINDSFKKMQKSLALKAEVEEALNKSQELIKQINNDDNDKKVEVPSDVGSLDTEILLSINPTEGYKGTTEEGPMPKWKSRHVYGYKRPRARRSKTMGSLQIAHDLMALTEEQPSQSFTARPSDKSAHVTFHDDVNKTNGEDVSMLLADSPNTSRLSRSSDKKLRERSRSVSPSILKRERKLFESGLRDKPIPDYYTEFNVTPPKPPTWIDTLNLSDVSDTDWNKRDFTVSKPPPSWVNDIDNSDVTSIAIPGAASNKKLEYHDLLRPLPIINTAGNRDSDHNDSLPPPGLTYKDLVSDTSKLSSSPAKPSLNEKLNTLKAKTDSCLRKYHERIQEDINLDSPSKGSNPYSGEGVPRCSSLDTAALIAGIAPPGKTDIISGASPIVPADVDSTVTTRGSPGKSRRGRSRSPDTDIVLEGDRPWERTVSYKAPVNIEDDMAGLNEQNYSGGTQPGSLECLKNMIFKLQQEAVHTDSEDEGSRAKLSEKVHKLRAEAVTLGIPVAESEQKNPSSGDTGEIPTLKGYDFHGEPGGQSLEKALVHLDRLKNLVSAQDPEPTTVTPLCVAIDSAGK